MKCIKPTRMGRPPGQRLTETDTKVLRQIAKEGFQTHAELRADILKDCNRTHSWDLMKRLVEMGLLVECRGDGGGIRGWSLSPRGQTDLHELFDEKWRASFRPPSYRSSFDHDLALREVKKILCESPVVSDWVPEHVLKTEVMSRIKFLGPRDRSAKLLTIPDAVFRIKSTGMNFKSALELELTRKSRKRLFHKLEAHVSSPDFDFVFFVLQDEKLLQVLWDVYQLVISNSVRVKRRQQQNAIYFTTLQNLREKRLDAPFAGLRENLVFAKIAA